VDLRSPFRSDGIETLAVAVAALSAAAAKKYEPKKPLFNSIELSADGASVSFNARAHRVTGVIARATSVL
jgi:hypothetical protein